MTQKARELADDVRKNPYCWPGGYPKFAVTDDGGCLCKKCCWTERKQIREADPGDGWEVQAVTINWEDANLLCDHCGERIESAYAEDEVESEESALTTA